MKKSGFTLVELIAVIIILGILAAVGIPQYRKAMERARGAEAYAGLANIQEGEKIYYTSNQAYKTAVSPMSAADQATLDVSLPQTGWEFGITSTDSTKDFTGTATRKAGQGPCAGNTIAITQAGAITDTWKTCVDGL